MRSDASADLNHAGASESEPAHHGLKSGIAGRITRGPSYVTACRLGPRQGLGPFASLYSTLSDLSCATILSLCSTGTEGYSVPVTPCTLPILCLAVCQFPSGYHARASPHLSQLCIDKNWGHWHLSFPICPSTLSTTILCLAVRQFSAGYSLAPPHMSQHARIGDLAIAGGIHLSNLPQKNIPTGQLTKTAKEAASYWHFK